jgi:chromosome segregation ATPase
MAGEIVLEEIKIPEGEQELLRDLEKKVGYLLKKFQELKNERDQLAVALDSEKTKMIRLEKRLELLSQDREKVKVRLDQLLLRLRTIDI